MAAIVLLSVPVRAADAPGSVKMLVDACGEMDDDLARVVENDVALVDAGAVARNADGSYRVTTEEYRVGAGTYTLCTDSRFYGQTMVFGLPFRSAVQVGPDLVLTAWHGTTSGVTPALYALFNLRYRLVNGRCVPPDLQRFPAADVFSVTEVVADGLRPDVTPRRDFLLLRLDREARPAYPRIRRSGRGRADADHQDRVTVVSHPDRLAAKMDLSGRITGYSGQSYTGPLVENVHPLQWSSGGMLYNRDARVLETVVRTAVNGWYSQVPGQACFRVAHNDGQGGTNDSVADFAGHIPAFELLVTPLDAVVHDARPGGPLSNERVVRTIEAPVTARGPITYRITLPSPSAPGPELLVTPFAPLQGTLAPGSGFDVEEVVDAAGVPCGQYEQTYSITDMTHGFTDVVRHVFRIACQ
jgi:hypothetical protein